MELIADMLLAAGAFGAAVYCFVLSRRLNRFTQLENGMGSAIAVLSAQVDDMTRALARAHDAAGGSTLRLEDLTQRAETVAARLELLVAALHDLPEQAPGPPPQGGESETEAGERRLRFVRRRAFRASEAAE